MLPPVFSNACCLPACAGGHLAAVKHRQTSRAHSVQTAHAFFVGGDFFWLDFIQSTCVFFLFGFKTRWAATLSPPSPLRYRGYITSSTRVHVAVCDLTAAPLAKINFELWLLPMSFAAVPCAANEDPSRNNLSPFNSCLQCNTKKASMQHKRHVFEKY